MKRLTIVAPCFYENIEPCQLFVDSCKRFNFNTHLYGLGEPWPWLYEAKVLRLIQEIEDVESEYILVNDADDAFFVSDEKEILAKYHQSGARVLVSADRQQDAGDAIWPQSIFRDHYPKSLTPWRYCNSGGYIGHKEDILNLLHAVELTTSSPLLSIWRSKDWSNDQFRMSIAYLNGYPLTIDVNCNLFQTMGVVEQGEVIVDKGRILNTVTNTKPCVVHFNGNALGIDEMYKQCRTDVNLTKL